ncbi:MAG TPA: hypothetical protein VMR25_00545 [Planctomycetaceae bacterium]|jgi:hypothetical protein|nr:hypothetical protein [Planctomycetaceae bacterium]
MRAFKKGRGVRVRALQITLFALTLFTACIGNAAPADPPRAQQQPEKSREPRPRITVSEKTTRILQPLDAEGYVDYFAALNQMTSQGVTPENNAEVLFVRALGGSDLQPPARARFFKLLKIERLPERGEYLAEFAQFVKEKTGRHATKKEEADFSSATQEPWAASDLPLVAEWLTSQAKPLDLIVEGTKRPKCYIPLAGSRQAGLLAVPLPAVQATRLPARALAARAMLRLREGKLSEAEQDLLACHRLGRLVGSAPFLIPALIGIAIDVTACQGDARLMEQGRLTAESALAYQQELRRLASLPVMADVIDGPERFVFLDQVSIFARDPKNAPHGVPDIFLRDYWDEILKFGNTQFDKAVAAARLPTAPER